MAHTACKMIWNLLLELGLDSLDLCIWFFDNQSAIYITQNSVFHKRIKHIEVDCHLVRNAWIRKMVSLPFTPSSK